MDRKFVIALSSLAGSMMLTEAHAIGLGEIKLRTHLNEPLKADIQLLQVKDLSENEILVNLASKDDFAKAGVDRDFLLTSLRFRLDLSDPKSPRVVVTTEQPIREPYLNFLVEVQWPSGRLLREYTLLMDLPAFADTTGGSARSLRGTSVPAGEALPQDEGVSEVGSEKPAASPEPRKPAAVREPSSKASARTESQNTEVAEQAPSQPVTGVTVRRATRAEIENYRASAPASETQVASSPVEQQAPATESDSSPATAPATESSTVQADGNYGPTQSSDTLWKIAQRVRPANGVSVHQTMVAIQRLNPQAFSNGNINLLKKGQVLKLPSQEEISSIGQSEAISAVDNQVAEWKAKRGQAAAVVGGQLDATGKAAEVAAAAPASEGQLKLAAPAEVAESKAGAGAGEASNSKAEIKALKNQLTVGMEELNRAQRENQDLASRAKDLDGQIANAEKLLNLQSGELAALQAKLAAEQQAKQDEQARLEAEAKAKAEAEAAAAAQPQQTPPATETPPAQVSADAAAPAVPAASTEVAQPPATEAATTDMAPQPAQPAEPAPAPQAEQAAAKPEPTKTPAVAESAESPMSSKPVIGGIAGVLALLLALFGYRRMAEKRAQREDVEDEFAAYEQAASEPAESSIAAEIDEDLVSLDDEIEAAQESAPAAEIEESPKQEMGDVLGEADIYISFGNFDKGEALLKTAIHAEPQRTDYRLKLLELYKEADNLAAFDEVYKDLIELDDDVANLRAGELRGRISGADSTPFAFGVASAAAAAGISDDELDLDFDLDAEPAVESAPLEAAAEEFDIDFSSDAATAEADEKPAETFDLDMDLDLDFELPASAPASEALTAKHPAIDLDSMNLDAPVAEIEPAAVAAEAESSVSVDDLGLDFDLDLDLDTGADAAVVAEPETVQVEPPAAAVAVAEDAGSSLDIDSSMLEAVTADAGEVDEELDFLSDADEAATKLDLARAYIDMGDKDGARDILEEVLEEGREEQKREARTLLDGLA